MTIPEVVEAFHKHTQHIPSRFIDLRADPLRLTLIDRAQVVELHRTDLESITDTDIEQHTSYANQRREEVIQTIVKGVVKYATLSHTWPEGSGGGFGYKEMTATDAVRDGPGWSKLSQFASVAKETFKCRFAWADTVCVDPDTPSDRQAAAASCFDWFRNAYVCVVYLAGAGSLSELAGDQWFRRGWPLPELLAPIRIKFYGSGWKPLNEGCAGAENDKADGCFLDVLSKASGIPVGDLRSFLPGPNRVREKLTWASRRKTTAEEDRAYSLISIFKSNMQINPEEREKAFLRLMLHIMPKSGECDVFAWAGPRAQNYPAIPSSPACYAKERRDHELDARPHRYRLCGDRNFSLDHNHLKIKVILIDLGRWPRWWGGYVIKPRSRKVSVSEIKLLSKDVLSTQMAVGVIDYDWTEQPSHGVLHEDVWYFGFLLQRTSKEAKWKKVDTEKVVFLKKKGTGGRKGTREKKETTEPNKLEELHFVFSQSA